MNSILSFLQQSNLNFSDHDATAGAVANSGGNFASGLIAINAANMATATAAAVNISPVTQVNLGLDIGSIADGDVITDVL